MVERYRQIILFIGAAAVMVACATATPAPTTDVGATALPLPTPTMTALAPTSLPSTIAPTAVLPTEPYDDGVDDMKIRLVSEDAVVTANLVDSQTTRDFVALLPLTLTLEDYAGAEKIAYLPRELSTEGAPSGSDPSVGDIAYYAPWGNLAIFYHDAGYANGLVILGSIDTDMDALIAGGPTPVTIELADEPDPADGSATP